MIFELTTLTLATGPGPFRQVFRFFAKPRNYNMLLIFTQN